MLIALRRACGLAIVLGALCGGARAATLPVGFTETILTSALNNATAMALLPDGRILVTQQGGLLRVIKSDALLPAAALTLTVDASGERGLLGVAADPSFATNGFIYLYYTVPGSPAHNRVSRFTMTGDTAASEVVLLDLDNLSSATNHNGGALHFGTDGKLYIAVGENANGSNAQTLTNLLGKILRINSDGSIPADNPFFSTAGARQEIWALGLRNPYTFAFRSNGRMLINDVGQSTYEEIDDGIAGSNYGWPTVEGPSPPGNATFRYPLYWYQHSTGTPTGCAITGGTFYDPAAPSFSAYYTGKYFFADFCGNFIWLFDPVTATAASFASSVPSPVDLQIDAQGRLLYLGHAGSGVLGRIAALPAQQFFTLTPCRALDTRAGDAPAIAAGATRTFPVAGRCGVPASAVSVSVNLTVVTPGQAGNALAFPGNFPAAPNTNGLSFRAGFTRANNLVLSLATNGAGSVKIQNTSTVAIQVVLDVNGYFQ